MKMFNLCKPNLGLTTGIESPVDIEQNYLPGNCNGKEKLSVTMCSKYDVEHEKRIVLWDDCNNKVKPVMDEIAIVNPSGQSKLGYKADNRIWEFLKKGSESNHLYNTIIKLKIQQEEMKMKMIQADFKPDVVARLNELSKIVEELKGELNISKEKN